MAVVLVHQGATVTLVHIAGDSPSGFRVVHVWESEEACNRFGEILGPHLQVAGITDPPETVRV
jgi:hypothetical protein